MCTARHVGLPTLFVSPQKNVKGRSQIRQVRKGGKSGKDSISRTEKKSTTKRYANSTDPRSYKVLNTSSFTDTKRSRSRQISFIAFHLLNFINQE